MILGVLVLHDRIACDVATFSLQGTGYVIVNSIASMPDRAGQDVATFSL